MYNFPNLEQTLKLFSRFKNVTAILEISDFSKVKSKLKVIYFSFLKKFITLNETQRKMKHF